ncbi:MAG TPA: J domain-containing protein [Polyangia bacterium]|nr:J domain-containing protein [Polyangia bacterium]
MSIGKRLIDLARSELNSLLDRAARADEDDDRGRRTRGRGEGDVGSMSDEELAAEIERRRQAREEVERVTSRSSRPTPRSSRPTGRAPGSFREEYAPPRRTAAGDEAIRRAYTALEVPPGSDFEAVKRSYRRLMRKYHPDLNAGSPERQKAATDLAQRLTQAYKILEKQLRK